MLWDRQDIDMGRGPGQPPILLRAGWHIGEWGKNGMGPLDLGQFSTDLLGRKNIDRTTA